MKGLPVKITSVFEPVSKLDCLKEYTLIGGTALALQIGHRLSEDLDFCKWPLPRKSEVNWPEILKELNSVFTNVEPDILGFNQVNFFADRIKLSFYSNQSNRSPVVNPRFFLNNIKIPDIQTIGVMKLEVMLRRSNFRDYYDIYSILNEGVSLKAMVEDSILYSNHILKTRDILNFISNGNNFKKEKQFELLQPKYSASEKDIEKFIKEIIRNEFPLSLTK
jgi:predicted nucleotidyltransferase component of viral defense system